MEAIAAGKGKKPKPFMTQGETVKADAVWDSTEGLAAEEREAGTKLRSRRRRLDQKQQGPQVVKQRYQASSHHSLRELDPSSCWQRLDPRDQV